MADLSDVISVLGQTVQGALYPNGTGQASVAGVDCKILTGWPLPKDLDADMAAGKVQVSVYPVPGMDRNTTRYPKVWQEQSVTAATVTLTVSNNTVTVGGTPAAGQTCLVSVNGGVYDYAVQAGDTLAGIAAGIAAAVPGASATGAVVTITNAAGLKAAVSTEGTAAMELRRQERVFQIIVWAPTPALRDSAAQAIDASFADLERLVMPDDFYARIIYAGTVQTDEVERQHIFRRTLNYRVEYATTKTETEATVGAEIINITPETGINTI